MSSAAPMRSEIWRPGPEIWPDFAKSEILPKSVIWLFCCNFRDLMSQIQISEGALRNLIRNLDFSSKISDLRQISDFGESTPKGVGGLPRKAGCPPPTPGQIPRNQILIRARPTTAARTAKHMTAVVFHPSSHPTRRPPMPLQSAHCWSANHLSSEPTSTLPLEMNLPVFGIRWS